MSASPPPSAVATKPGAEFRERRSRAVALLDEAAALAGRLGADETRPVLGDAATRLRSGRLHLIVIGEFKRGKTSLVNALLNEPDLLPVGVDITTNTVTSVRYGERERVLAYSGDGDEPTEITRAEIPAYVSEQHNPGNARDTRHLVVELPKDELQDGMVVNDLPGVGGRNAAHTAATYAFVRQADAALFVTDVTQTVTQEELDFLGLIREQTDKLVFVMTKKDQDRHYAETVAAEREKLAAHLGVASSEIRMIAVSSRDKLAWARDGDPQDLELSGFPELEEELWQRLGVHAGDALLAAAIGELRAGLSALRAPIEAERRALARRDEARSAALRAEFERYDARLVELQQEGADWQRMLVDEIRRLERELPVGLDAAFEELRGRVAAGLEDDEKLARPQEIVNEAALEVARAVADVRDELGERAGRIQARVLAAAQLALKEHPVALRVPGAGEAVAVRLPDAPLRGDRVEAARAGFFEFSAFSSTTASLGLLAAGSVVLWPLAVGAGIGALAGWSRMRRTLEQTRARERRETQDEIRRALRPVIEDAHKRARQALMGAIGELGGVMRDELARLIVQERRVQARAKEQVIAAGRTSQAEAGRRMAELDESLLRIDELDGRVHALDV